MSSWPRTYSGGPPPPCSECAKLTAERDKLREALEWVAGEMLEQGGVLAPDWFDAMRERGLLVPMPADRTYKADYGEDTMYVLAWRAKGGQGE